MKTVSIVIPTKDEEETIGMLLADLKVETEKLKDQYGFETIVVDDGCVDKTVEVAKEYGCKIIVNGTLHGKGRALDVGFKFATGEYVVMMDGDYSHKPADLSKLLFALDHGCGLVIASRHLGGSGEYTLVRAFGNHFLAFAFRVMFGVGILDPLNGYKAFRSDIAQIGYESKDFEIEIEIISNALKKGYDVCEVPSFERARAGGKMKSRAYIHGPKFLMKILKLGFKHRFGKR